MPLKDKFRFMALYERFANAGNMQGYAGICAAVKRNAMWVYPYNSKEYREVCTLLNMVRPTSEDFEQLDNEGTPMVYFGAESHDLPYNHFGPRRQNLLLLLACLNDEL